MGPSKVYEALLASNTTLAKLVTDLGQRVDKSRQEVRTSVEAAVENLRGDVREMRSRTNAAAAYADTAVNGVNDLAREVEQLRAAVAVLQRSVDSLADHPHFQTAAAETPSPAAPAAVSEPDAPAQPPVPDDVPDAAPVPDNVAVPSAQAAAEPSSDGDGPVPGDGGAVCGTGGDGPSDSCGVPHGQDPNDGERDEHHALLVTAATAGTVNIVAHRDTWEFFAQRAAGQEHFGTPSVTDHGDGRIRAVLSGRSLIGLAIALRDTRQACGHEGTWALAHAFYQRIAKELPAVHRDGDTPLTITFDDGTTATADSTDITVAPPAGAPTTWHKG